MGGSVSTFLSTVTGGLIKSDDQKRAEKAQEQAIKTQESLLARQTENESASLTRKARLASGGGAMSLLSGSQLGVDEKKKVLG